MAQVGTNINAWPPPTTQPVVSQDLDPRQRSESTLAQEDSPSSDQINQTLGKMHAQADDASGGKEEGFYVKEEQTLVPPKSVAVAETGTEVESPIEPDGGMQRWVQVIACLFAYANTSGLLNSYGVWQAAYARGVLSDEPESKIAWIGSMQGFAMFTIAILTGPLIDMGKLRYITAAGTFLITFGLCMASIATKFWQLILAQGVVVGIGSGCFFLPCVIIPPQWFPEHLRTTVVGLVATGTVFGGVIYPIVFNAIYNRVGLGWATRAVALIILPMNLCSFIILRMRLVPMQRRQLYSREVVANKAFWISCGLFFFGMSVIYVPIQFLTQYAESSPNIPSDLAQNMLPIVMAGSFPGRIIPDIMADRWGVLNLVIPCVLSSAILCFCWIAVQASTGGTIVFGILYGFFSGAWMSMLPMVCIATTGNFEQIGTRIGLCMFIAACGILAGSPIAGAILNDTHSYLGMQLFSGSLLLLATGFMVWLRYYRVGWKWTKI